MRLKTLMAACIVVLAFCGIASASASPSNSSKPLYVHLKCYGPPCGTDGKVYYHGHYRVDKSAGFSPKMAYVVTVTYPNGEPYDKYDRPTDMYGVHGGLKYTDQHGKPSDFKWYAANGRQCQRTDPPGLYHVTFTTQVGTKVKHYKTSFRMRKLSGPCPNG